MDGIVFEQALKKGAKCERLSREEAYGLAETIRPDRLHRLGRAALENRQKRYGSDATYVFNLQINPSNICGSGCTFCNYAASRNAPHAYVMKESEILNQVHRLQPTEAHIVGGLNQIWSYARNLALVRSLRTTFPDLHIKAFTAVEIQYFAKTSGLSESQVLDQLMDAGLDAMPGGGAEIFSQRLYEQHWKNKASPEQWVRIHQLAHGKGIPTNATMLFGFGDSWEERIEHLLILRQAQDASGGFACFIPLPFQPGAGHFIEKGPTPIETLAVLAISRLVLDNIAHLKSYWPMTGLETGAAGLSWGADDMDGTISEEKIAHLAGADSPVGMARDNMVETIQTAGFNPVERDGLFSAKEAAA
ncbi:MAG: aminofutalosine synthase MqnE [Proteobacteria bacterium]|nr:MAG: aminofutalosine synthase MqnE [Pseudomonadota bacterium]PIE67294.1 MAG: aminofutalosine synthase MqnE [Deltaproteobacteria bacterium]